MIERLLGPSRRPRLAALLLILLAGTLAACGNAGYYAQAIGGHLAVMRAATPIDQVLDAPAGTPALKQQLRSVQSIRDFASRELALPDNGSYRSYADIGRAYVVWNVFATPELSLEAKKWCLLIVGCTSYRGYYARNDADRLAAELRREGYDTYVAGVPAYSTLGHFDDPVLNTFLQLGTTEVARVIFHELAHQLVFASDDTPFNESFATAVENEGMRRWLTAHATPEQRSDFNLRQQRKAAFLALLQRYRERLQSLYARDGEHPAEELRAAKAELFAALRADYGLLKEGWGGHAGYDGFFAEDLNNARLASLSLYSQWVPAFEALLASQSNDLPAFYRRVAELAALDQPTRRDALTQLLALQATRYVLSR